jgi:histidine ammonia-lyase
MGTEDHGSYSGRAAAALRESVPAIRTLLGCELVTALRAARSAVAGGNVEVGEPMRALMESCGALPMPGADRDLVDELATAEQLLENVASFAQVTRAAASGG